VASAQQSSQYTSDAGELLKPTSTMMVKLGIGEAKNVHFSCMGGPADAIVHFTSYAERADPLLFLSLDPSRLPTYNQHDASTFAQWREDSSGDHYVIAKGVGPQGGLLQLLNTKHFGSEELMGFLQIRCSFIIAFDTLFWDPLKLSSICPVGSSFQAPTLQNSAEHFCSGHGKCSSNGKCQCDSDFVGPACEHSKKDVVVAADGHYRFKVETGRYQYFKIKIPPRFSGGYLSVNVMAKQPVVVLVRENDIPTKSNFELSNFDDWLDHDYLTSLKFPVKPASALQQPASSQASPQGFPRRLLDELREDSDSITSWSDLLQKSSLAPKAESRRLDTGLPPLQECSGVAPKGLGGPACETEGFHGCQSSCSRCMTCVKGGFDGRGDMGCSDACDACTSAACAANLAYCAGNVSCDGEDARTCDAGCSNCLACFDSNDPKCTGCRCCLHCLPIAAKCTLGEGLQDNHREVYVAVFNHRRYYNEMSSIAASANIQLVADPSFVSTPAPGDWIATLYDSFQDIRVLGLTQREVYPEGQQFVFNVDLSTTPGIGLQVQLFRDRLTLLRISGVGQEVGKVLVDFDGKGPNITHVLSSSQAAPKTFFDFDRRHEHRDGHLEVPIHQPGSGTVWLAMFAGADGVTLARVTSEASPGEAPDYGYGFGVFLWVLGGIAVCFVVYNRLDRILEGMGMDPEIPLLERLGCLIRQHTQHESTVGLTRQGSLSGYIGSDELDRSVEEQYLHRGGAGDDGI